jgi:hypothetical protein
VGQTQPAPGVQQRIISWADELPTFGKINHLDPLQLSGNDLIASPTYTQTPANGEEVEQDESCEDWWYAHVNCFDPVTHEFIGVAAAGYSHILNWSDAEEGCFGYTLPNYLSPELFETWEHRRPGPWATLAFFDLQGAMVWCKVVMPGTFYALCQDPVDGGILGIGEASFHRDNHYADAHVIHYNPVGNGSDPDIAQVPCGTYGPWVLKNAISKFSLAGAHQWTNMYGADTDLASAWVTPSRGLSILPLTVDGANGYLSVGFTREPGGGTDRCQLIRVRADGSVKDQRTVLTSDADVADLALTPTDGLWFRGTDVATYGGGQKVLITGGVLPSSGAVRSALLVLDPDEGGIYDLHVVANTGSIDLNGPGLHDPTRHQYSTSAKFAFEGGAARAIWPVLRDYALGTGISAGVKWADFWIHKYDITDYANAPVRLWAQPANLGEVRAYDLQADVCVLAGGESFVALSSRWPDPFTVSAPFERSSLPPDADACLGEFEYDLDPAAGSNQHLDWNFVGDFQFWNTDTYMSKMRLSDGVLEWTTTFDAAPDEERVCYPGDLKKQECMYKITELPDGALMVSGNTSHNQDDSYLAKLYPDCQSAVAYDPAISAAVLTSTDHSYTVAANETWGTNKKVHGTIVVPDGHTLNINNNALIEFADSRLLDHPTRLIVEAGGRLNISADATLTSLPGCNGQGAMWDGIIVRGNLDHPLQEPLASSAQGYASVRNCRIENARVGISVGEDLLATNSMAVAQTLASGGIVIADNVFFSNNVRDVVFSPFENHHGDYPNGLYGIADNKSRFRRCTFSTSATLNDAHQRPQAHATLFGVRGVRFQGCNFDGGGVFPYLDEYDNTVNTDQSLGQGIKSLNSTFAVEALCQPQQWGDPCTEAELVRNTFTNLWYGVNASTFGDMSRTFIVDRSDFAGCVKGIRMEGIQDPGITLNTFEVGDLPVGDLAVTPYGVYSDQCTGYEIEENRFSTDARYGATPKVGLIIKDSGKYANTFYNNTFDGLYVGSLIEGNNANDGETVGLEVKCNDYGLEAKCDFDVALTGDAVKVQSTQGSSSGDPDAPAGNRFSLDHYGSFDVEEDWFVEDNGSTVAEYFHHIPTPGNRTEPTYRDVLNLFATPVTSNWPDKETACPSNLAREKSRSEKRSASVTEDEAYNDGKDAYDAAKDNGDTYTLEAYVSDPTKSSTQVRTALQSVAPNVSAEVWQAAFGRSPGMSAWNITQALLSNSPLQGEVLRLMHDSGLPSFYTGLVENAQTGEANILSLLESGMAYHAGQKAEALQGLGRESFLDSLDLDERLDSLKLWHEELPADNHGLAVSAVLAAKGDMAGLYDLADSYVLADDNPNLYGLVKRYTAGWAQADETTRIWVSDLAAQRSVMGSAQANAWREALGEASMEEIILLPLEIRAAMNVSSEQQQPVEWADEVVLEAYPNPTKGPVYIIYRTPVENVQLDIRVVDANGREVYSGNVASGSGIVELNTASWISGLYVAEFSSVLMEPAHVKLSVLR